MSGRYQILASERSVEIGNDELAYGLLEEGRLRCAQLLAAERWKTGRLLLGWIHDELGTAGFLASFQLGRSRRLQRLAIAHRRSDRTLLAADRPHALAGVMICAEDALAEQIARGDLTDHLQRAHCHVLRAMDLLAAHLDAIGVCPNVNRG